MSIWTQRYPADITLSWWTAFITYIELLKTGSTSGDKIWGDVSLD